MGGTLSSDERSSSDAFVGGDEASGEDLTGDVLLFVLFADVVFVAPWLMPSPFPPPFVLLLVLSLLPLGLTFEALAGGVGFEGCVVFSRTSFTDDVFGAVLRGLILFMRGVPELDPPLLLLSSSEESRARFLVGCGFGATAGFVTSFKGEGFAFRAATGVGVDLSSFRSFVAETAGDPALAAYTLGDPKDVALAFEAASFD